MDSPSPTTDILWNSLTSVHFTGCVNHFPKFNFLRADGAGFVHNLKLKSGGRMTIAEGVDAAWICKLQCHRHDPTILMVQQGAGSRKRKAGEGLGGGTCSPCAVILVENS